VLKSVDAFNALQRLSTVGRSRVKVRQSPGRCSSRAGRVLVVRPLAAASSVAGWWPSAKTGI